MCPNNLKYKECILIFGLFNNRILIKGNKKDIKIYNLKLIIIFIDNNYLLIKPKLIQSILYNLFVFFVKYDDSILYN